LHLDITSDLKKAKRGAIAKAYSIFENDDKESRKLNKKKKKKKAKVDPDIAERAAVLANLKKQIAVAKVNAQRAATIEAQKQIEK